MSPTNIEITIDELTRQNATLRAALAVRHDQIEHLFRHSGRHGSACYDALEVSAAWDKLRSPVLEIPYQPGSIAEAMEDTARVDWLEEQGLSVYSEALDDVDDPEKLTLRQRIDLARKREK